MNALIWKTTGEPGATGRNALDEVKQYCHAALQWNCLVGTAMGLIVCIGQRPIAIAFVPKSTEVQDILMTLMSLDYSDLWSVAIPCPQNGK